MVESHVERVPFLRRLQWTAQEETKLVAQRVVLEVDGEVAEAAVTVVADVLRERALVDRVFNNTRRLLSAGNIDPRSRETADGSYI